MGLAELAPPLASRNVIVGVRVRDDVWHQVTVNVNLLDDFTGAGLAFCGRYVDPTHRKHTRTYQHIKVPCMCGGTPCTLDAWLMQLRVGVGSQGRAVIHSGKHRHGALNIKSGRRSNLIVW